ncbi:hypothetical protein Emin_1187 [Elusimicrobium minutum Pei191]|uniref:Uncharacterized protein n=1 Tax=Elusimicrobium minutum (strain Pei191) TaxID=445932 RepID=B2KDZ1_ELUMP|nr:hypothetical protein [Elusimicrobium minutum]ACC98737.1 hypothetical protein Emin_1187 [Elusimicrobium minutum Pei191]
MTTIIFILVLILLSLAAIDFFAKGRLSRLHTQNVRIPETSDHPEGFLQKSTPAFFLFDRYRNVKTELKKNYVLELDGVTYYGGRFEGGETNNKWAFNIIVVQNKQPLPVFLIRPKLKFNIYRPKNTILTHDSEIDGKYYITFPDKVLAPEFFDADMKKQLAASDRLIVESLGKKMLFAFPEGVESKNTPEDLQYYAQTLYPEMVRNASSMDSKSFAKLDIHLRKYVLATKPTVWFYMLAVLVVGAIGVWVIDLCPFIK